MSPLRFVVVVLVCAFSSSIFAATYYVAPSGNDSASGLAPNSAWKTLQRAANVVTAGDKVIALPGNHAGFNLFTSGAPGNPITFTASPGATVPNPLVVVNTNNGFTNKDRINLEGASFVVIEGFTVLGSNDPATNRTGVRAVLGQGVVVRACRIDQCGRWAVLTGFVDDMVVEDCECSRSVAEHGIYFSNSGDRPIARRNHIWGNRSNGIHVNGDLSQGGDGVITGALIEQNVIHGNGIGGGSGINCDGVQDSVIQNNLLYDNHASGISLYRIDGGGPSSGNVVVNNTVHVAANGRWALNLKDGAVNTTARNNVLVNDHPSRGSIDLASDCLPGLVSDWNAVKDRFAIDDVFMGFAQWKAQTGADAHSFVATVSALFANASAGDYQLAAGSPAIDHGTATGAPAVDLPGRHRPALLGFDVGAYEFAACFGTSGSYGSGKPGTGALVPALGVTGCPDLGGTATLHVANGRGGAVGTLLVGTTASMTPFLGGTLLVVPQLAVPFVLSGAPGSPGSGSAAWPVAVPDQPALAGATARTQAWVADPVATFGAAATAGLAITLGSG